MLFGGKITFRGKIATLLFASTSTSALNEYVENISSAPGNYTEIIQPSGRDRITDDIYKGMKNPMYAVIHSSHTEQDDFISVNEIELKDRADWEYFQDRQILEDSLEEQRDIQEMVSLDAISGIENHTSIASRLGIDKEDAWDTRTDKQKAEDAAASSAHYGRLVTEGVIMDEAIAPAHEQGGNREQAILDAVENIKNGMNFVDPNNIPAPLQATIDEMIANGELEEDDVGDYIDEINKRVKEDCESGDLNRISRIFGDIRVDETGVHGGKFHVNLKDAPQKPEARSKNRQADELTEKLMKKLSSDELADIMKPATVDGNVKKDVSKYIFDNTSMDMYDFKDALAATSTDEKEATFNEASLPENIGAESDISYDSNTEEYAVISHLIEEDSDLRAFSVSKIGVDITDANVIGTNNVGDFMVTNGFICYTRKDNTYGTSYFTIEANGKKYVYNVNI